MAEDPTPADASAGPVSANILDERTLGLLFDRVEGEQYDLHRRASARAASLADALAGARQRAGVYALAGDPNPEETAERCAALELAARLHMSDMTVRSLAFAADTARTQLPLLWTRAREGFISMRHIEFAVALLPRFEVTDAASETRHVFDEAIAALAMTTSAATFRARATSLARRLAPEPESARHARAFADRRVTIQNANDGMSYLQAYIATVDALAIKRRLTATAKHTQKRERARGIATTEGGGSASTMDTHDARLAAYARPYPRTRDQTRADLLVDWLRGTGTLTAVKTKVFVTVPLDRLDPSARGSVRSDVVPRRGIDLARESLLLGEGAIDDATAVRLLIEAGRFTRIVTHPVSGAMLDMDRRSRSATRYQREWLVLTHGTCTRDGCRRSALGADIDHWREFFGRERGSTDIENLHPFCEPDHRVKGTTRLEYRRRDDGSVQLVSPTGFMTRSGPRPDLDTSRRQPAPILDAVLSRRGEAADDPPF